MINQSSPGATAPDPRPEGAAGQACCGASARAGSALAAAVALSTAVASTALATTAVVKKNPGGITAAGPVNTEYGFPAWYQDSKGMRTELCLDGNDPMCGFVAAPVEGFDNTAPTVFPDQLPGRGLLHGGRVLADPAERRQGHADPRASRRHSSNAVQNGDQITFARQRIFVVGGPASTTLHFHHPYGDIDIDTDASGKGRITEDIAPSVGNFDGVAEGQHRSVPHLGQRSR